ncbi:hypothetical protein B0J13DRAFT_529134 [Dactylonectria estremocensis]|uniref:Uncharacterized protein n=1 Tax=Dactylonectria estremocensis TaxID=1079267 RepID=A0A9P9E9T1_9HYPO|nr:hypothetical protein B0J13DRAFT_529134 [Dactylonectria estremocensis]
MGVISSLDGSQVKWRKRRHRIAVWMGVSVSEHPCFDRHSSHLRGSGPCTEWPQDGGDTGKRLDDSICDTSTTSSGTSHMACHPRVNGRIPGIGRIGVLPKAAFLISQCEELVKKMVPRGERTGEARETIFRIRTGNWQLAIEQGAESSAVATSVVEGTAFACWNAYVISDKADQFGWECGRFQAREWKSKLAGCSPGLWWTGRKSREHPIGWTNPANGDNEMKAGNV